MSLEKLITISPITNQPILTRNGLSDADITTIRSNAAEAFKSWKQVHFEERLNIVKKALTLISKKEEELAKELTEHMGRPIAYTPSEIKTAVKRGEYICKIAADALADTPGETEKGFNRFIKKVPVGPVLIIFAWNVSLLSSRLVTYAHIVNSIHI
jgi:acyl-CoA reductase-like NAD-dependent aldehyde dehydrogenase